MDFSRLGESTPDGIDQSFDGRCSSSILQLQHSITLTQEFGQVRGVEYQGPEMDQLLEILEQYRIGQARATNQAGRPRFRIETADNSCIKPLRQKNKAQSPWLDSDSAYPIKPWADIQRVTI